MPDPYISEVLYHGAGSTDFIEVAVDAGTDVSNLVVTVYRDDGTVRTSNSLAGLSNTTIAGKDVYVIQSGAPSSFNGLGSTQAVSLSESGTVYSFVSFNNNPATVTATAGPASGLTSTEIGTAGAGTSLETIDDGVSYYTQTTPNSGTIPCLCDGTFVQTDLGEMRVEDLGAGMQIMTISGEFETLRMTLSKKVTSEQMQANPKLYPIRISAHALGNGLPKRDLLVSRQHRMLISSPIVERMFDEKSVLVAAVRLLSLPGVFIDETAECVEYFHLLFDRHQVIFAEGAPTESLFLGAETFKALPEAVMEEIETLFSDFCRDLCTMASALLIPQNHRQKSLISRHVKNGMPVLKNHDVHQMLRACS